MRAAIDGEALHAAALRGELAKLEPMHSLRDASGGERAWILAARAAASFLDPIRFTAPAPVELAALAGEGSARATSLACAHGARAAVIAFEPERLRPWLALADEIGPGPAERASEPAIVRALGLGWLAWMEGGASALQGALADAERAARDAGAATLVVDAAILRALAAEEDGDLEEAMAQARRAARMARVEALPGAELLSSLVLARARRATHRPHLAIRILSAIARVASGAFAGWTTWESLLAGDTTLVPRALALAGTGRAEVASRALGGAIRAAMTGSADGFDRDAAALERATRGLLFAEREALEVLLALDARRAVAQVEGGGAGIGDWCGARTALAPRSIHGLCVRFEDEPEEGAAEGVVLAAPGCAPRRVLGLGAPLLEANGLVRLRKTRRRQGRVETLVAVLASAGADGLEDAECFAQAYELRYEPEIHRGVFDVLITRARAYLEDAGEIVRGRGRISLRLRTSIAVPDPRCAARVHDRLLRVLAREGRASAGEAARKVGLSVRAVQDALKSLAEDGACVGEKEGRQIVYAVEDTTFSETTELLALRRARPTS